MNKLFFLNLVVASLLGMQPEPQKTVLTQPFDWSEYGVHEPVPPEMQELFDSMKNRQLKKKEGVPLPRIVALIGGTENGRKQLVNAFVQALSARWGLDPDWQETPAGECDSQLRVVYFHQSCVNAYDECCIQAAQACAEKNCTSIEVKKRYPKEKKKERSGLISRLFTNTRSVENETWQETSHSIPYDYLIFHTLINATWECWHVSYDRTIELPKPAGST